MSEMNDFNPARDEALGALLRDHLSAPDDAAFVARMRAEAVAMAQANGWGAVAHWALPGLARRGAPADRAGSRVRARHARTGHSHGHRVGGRFAGRTGERQHADGRRRAARGNDVLKQRSHDR